MAVTKGPGPKKARSARSSSAPPPAPAPLPPASSSTSAASEDASDWPNAIEAMQHAGITFRELMRGVRAGAVRRVFVGAQWRFDPKALELLADGAEGETDVPRVTADILTASAEAMRQALDHSERGFKLHESGAQRVLELLAKENERLQKENERLQESHAAAIAAREEQLSQVHERQLASQFVAARSKREERVLGMLATAVPRLLGHESGEVSRMLGAGGDVASTNPAALGEADAERLLSDPAVRRKVVATLKLLGELEPVKLEALLGAGFLSTDEEALIRVIVDQPAPNGAQEKGDNNNAHRTE